MIMMRIILFLLFLLAIHPCSWGSAATTEEKSAMGIPGETFCNNSDCTWIPILNIGPPGPLPLPRTKVDIRKDILATQDLAKMLEQQIADATAIKDYATALALDNKLKTIPDQIAQLKNELLTQTPSTLSRPAADVARLSMEACYAKVQRNLTMISEGLDIAAEIVDALLMEAARYGVAEIAISSPRYYARDFVEEYSYSRSPYMCCPPRSLDRWHQLSEDWQLMRSKYQGKDETAGPAGPAIILAAAVALKNEETKQYAGKCETVVDTTKCMFVGETCALATKELYAVSNGTERSKLQSLMAIQSSFSVDDIEAAAAAMQFKGGLGLAYLAWNLLRQGYRVQLDHLRAGQLVVDLWQPLTNVTHVDTGKGSVGGRLVFDDDQVGVGNATGCWVRAEGSGSGGRGSGGSSGSGSGSGSGGSGGAGGSGSGGSSGSIGGDGTSLGFMEMLHLYTPFHCSLVEV
jgi:hypothetical protein